MIEELLMTGADNPTTGKELARLLSIDVREVTRQIEKERRKGSPICASNDSMKPGYYLPETPEELEEYTDLLKHRAVEIFRTRQALIKVLKQVRDQKNK